jgi:hypothetical protein
MTNKSNQQKERAMTYKILRGTLMFGAMHLALIAAAQAKTDPLRCSARALRCQSHFYECLAYCDRRTDAQRQKPADVLQTLQTRCEAACDARHAKKLAYIESRPPCQDIVVPPNPRACEARYLDAASGYMVCQSRCATRDNPPMCLTNCTTRYETELDQVKAAPVCKNGPAKSLQIPGLL